MIPSHSFSPDTESIRGTVAMLELAKNKNHIDLKLVSQGASVFRRESEYCGTILCSTAYLGYILEKHIYEAGCSTRPIPDSNGGPRYRNIQIFMSSISRLCRLPDLTPTNLLSWLQLVEEETQLVGDIEKRCSPAFEDCLGGLAYTSNMFLDRKFGLMVEWWSQLSYLMEAWILSGRGPLGRPTQKKIRMIR